jgi:hypothetical protein
MYAPQSTQLAAPRGSRILPAIVSALVVLAIVAMALAIRSVAVSSTASDTGAVASEQFDSPALHSGFASATRPVLDSPALHGGFQAAGSYKAPAGALNSGGFTGIPYSATIVATQVTSMDAADSLRKEHLGVAPATVSGSQAAGSYKAPAGALNSGGFTGIPYSATIVATQVTSMDTADSLRKEHLGIAPATAGGFPVTSSRDQIERYRGQLRRTSPAQAVTTDDALNRFHKAHLSGR